LVGERAVATLTDHAGRSARPRPRSDGLNDTTACGFFTAFLLLEPAGKGTRYTASVLHGTEADRKRHADMGFEQGWGPALDQLVAVVKTFLAPR
jgi:uncharacterized protein YndB with AHSA1/START domain